MKKVFIWLIAILTGLASLLAMMALDFVLSLIWHFIGKIPFLSEIADGVGDILDLGLTALLAIGVATSIWAFGHSIINKLSGKSVEFQKSPVSYVNVAFSIMFLGSFIFLGCKFIMLVGGTVAAYTDGYQGVGKLLLFAKAIKDTASFVCNENIILYNVGKNSLILSVINLFSDKFIH